MQLFSSRATGRRVLKFHKLTYTVELQWFEHLLKHENIFGTMIVGAKECKSYIFDFL